MSDSPLSLDLQRARAVQRASLVSVIGNALLAVAKLSVGIIAGSFAVIADGIDSSTDVLISIVSLFAASIMAKPSDLEHPFGHTRAETMGTTILAFIIFFAGAQLALTSIQSLINQEQRGLPGIASFVVLGVSIAGKLLLAFHQYRSGRKHSSAMLIANGKNMRNDVLMSAAVVLGLFFTYILHVPILDPIIALALSVWILKTSIGIFLEVNTELMDGNTDHALYEQLFAAVRCVEGASHPHRARIRRMSNLLSIDLDVEVDPSLRVDEAHEIARAVEHSIKTHIPSVYDVMVHIEPRNSHEEDEQFGLSERRLQEALADKDNPDKKRRHS